MTKKIYLIDGNSFIYRMFFGVPEFSTKDGRIVNATFGMAKFFINQLKRENPDYLVFIKDAKGDNFRHELFKEYKATRDRMPDNLRVQIADIESMIKMMGIDIIEIPGYEADDVIGTLATEFSKNTDYITYVLTGDKDLYSLVKDNVKIYDTQKRKVYGIEETNEKFKLKEPEYIVDYLAIVGDKVDNIPGIEGFGPKKAELLINGIGTIEEIYDVFDNQSWKNLDEATQKCFKGKAIEKLESSRENAFLSKKLATLHKNVYLEGFKLEDFSFKNKNLLTDDVIEFFRELEFNSLIGEPEKELKTWKDLGLEVQTICSNNELNNLLFKIKSSNKITIDTENTTLDVFKAELLGISIFIDNDNIYYINIGHDGEKVNNLNMIDFLIELFELDILIIGHNLKYDLQIIDLYKKSRKNNASQDNNLGQINLGI